MGDIWGRCSLHCFIGRRARWRNVVQLEDKWGFLLHFLVLACRKIEWRCLLTNLCWDHDKNYAISFFIVIAFALTHIHTRTHLSYTVIFTHRCTRIHTHRHFHTITHSWLGLLFTFDVVIRMMWKKIVRDLKLTSKYIRKKQDAYVAIMSNMQDRSSERKTHKTE